MNLPESIRKVAEAEYNRYPRKYPDEHINSQQSFNIGVSWLYQHLLSMGEEFDDRTTEEHFRSDIAIDGHTEFYACVKGARWQHTQSAAQIAALKTRIKELEKENRHLLEDLEK